MPKKIDEVRMMLEGNLGQAVAFCFGPCTEPSVYVSFPTGVQGEYPMTFDSDRHAVVSLDGSVSYIEGGMVVDNDEFTPKGLAVGDERVNRLLAIYGVSSETVLTKLRG